MSDKIIFTADGRLNTKKRRLVECKKSVYSNSVPSSYKVNGTKEELCFEYIRTFNEQFKSLYPFRKPLYMTADNELGVKKFVCTTLRPTQLPRQELYDVFECASFLSGYMLYEPLDPPFQPPAVLSSPTYTINNHCGDPFEVANVMCSFLLGGGYDAYMVHGYAPQYVTLKDQKNTACPLLAQSGGNSNSSNETKGRAGAGAGGGGGGGGGGSIESNSDQKYGSNEEVKEYVPIDNNLRDSVFLRKKQEQAETATRDDFDLWITDSPPVVDVEEDSPSNGLGSIHGKSKKKKGIYANVQPNSDDMNKYLNLNRRVHCWILIVAGKREVKENLLVEPSTGRIYTVSNSPYFAVESVWNNVNYWVNLKPFTGLDRLDFDLDDKEHWTSLFIEKDSNNSSSKKKKAAKKEASGGNDPMGLLGDDGANEISEGKEGGGSSSSSSSSEDAALVRMFDAPPTWVAELSFERSQFSLQYPPNGRRTVNYFCAKAEFFGKGVHAQCILMKITVFVDKECTVIKEIHEWFDSRNDKLYKRSRFYLGQRHFIELYHPGSNSEIKQWKEYPGKSIEIDFHVDGRLDRLYRREDFVGRRVVEYFSKRTDFLNLRAIDFSTIKGHNEQCRLILPGGGLAPELYVTQMTQLYDQNPKAKPGSDVSRRSYFVKDCKMVEAYHFAKDQVTGRVLTLYHTKTPGTAPLSEKALSQEEGVDDTLEKQQEAAGLERDCFTTIKTSFGQIQKLVDFRTDTYLMVERERTVYEIALDSAEEKSPYQDQNASKEEFKSGDKSQKLMDYLSPFLRHVKDSRKITREEALEIRQNCLDSLRSRLIERQNIIQTRLNDENAKLARKQEQFQRSQRDGDLSTEEYEKYCTEAMFRINILEQRLVSHSETSLQKYAELDNRLANDTRLHVLRI